MFECSIVQKEEIHLVGMSFAGPAPSSFPGAAIQLQEAFWPRRAEIQRVVNGDVLISPFHDQNESFVTYWACCEVEGHTTPPAGMQAITLPARQYARITCSNRTIGEGYSRLNGWMKQHGYQRAERASMIEMFYIGQAVDGAEERSAAAGEPIEERVELLSPIKPKASESLVERIDAVFLPVQDLEESVAWYQDVFGFKVRWQNNRMAGLAVGSNVGFHLVKVREWEPSDKYTPLNLAARDAEAVRARLEEKHVRLSDWRQGEPVRFDFWDNTGNIISLIQL